MDSNNPFYLLDERIQKYIHRQNWQDLNEIQKIAIKPILEQKNDIVISAGTASGKTEAAFFPALTKVLSDKKSGISILSISPLKALIDDQTRRLIDICEPLDIAVTPWHGDIGSNAKFKQIKDPSGIILITPESLESLLINRRSWIKEAMSNLGYIIIDEFHAFMGTSRGVQLVSQLHRLENIIGKSVVRVALSATFSEHIKIENCLRPNNLQQIKTIVLKSNSSKTSLATQVRGYINLTENDKQGKPKLNCEEVIEDIYRLMRGQVNLIFANSRELTEDLAAKLQEKCKKNHVPNEFFPHHSLIAKDFRKNLELRLQEGKVPTTVICTSTLELGIDISDVNTIGQIDYASSVASLRQRLGRSGRRDGLAKLRVFTIENDSNQLVSRLRLNTFISIAMVKLLLDKWFEDPGTDDFFLSTLIQQILSVIASNGSVSAKNIYDLLCKTGPFNNIDTKMFMQVLRDMGQADLIMQMADGKLCSSIAGERLISKYDFYVTFDIIEEYIIEYNNHIIGRIPKSAARFLQEEDVFLLSGQSWKVIFINFQNQIIAVKPSSQHASTLDIGRSRAQIHDEVARTVYNLYLKGEYPKCLNSAATTLFDQGREMFFELGLDKKHYAIYQETLYITPWVSNKIVKTIFLLLKHENLKSSVYEGIITLEYCSLETLKFTIMSLLHNDPIKPEELLKKAKNLDMDKYDQYLSRELKIANYTKRNLDIEGAYAFLERFIKELKGVKSN